MTPIQGKGSMAPPPAEERDYQLLARAFGGALVSPKQMTPRMYFRIAAEVLCRAPCRLLICGAGRDTELYVRANAGGCTVVLEQQPNWAAAVQHLGCTLVAVTYQTRLADGFVESCPLPGGLPDDLLAETWDVILVDGPRGYGPNAPGRQQSILLAARLARPGTTIFLHDWERPMERQCADVYLKPPDEIFGKGRVLAVFRYR